MGTPYFGHGYLEWFYEQAKSQVVTRYVLPWESPQHKPDIDGQAHFNEGGYEFTIHYLIRHIAYDRNTALTLNSPDGDFRVVVTPNGAQGRDHYLTLVQGYPVSPPSQTFPSTFTLSIVGLPSASEAPVANPETWKYEWEKDLPPEFTVTIANPKLSTVDFKRWMGWQDAQPPGDWASVSAAEAQDLRRLGMFAMVESEEQSAA